MLFRKLKVCSENEEQSPIEHGASSVSLFTPFRPQGPKRFSTFTTNTRYGSKYRQRLCHHADSSFMLSLSIRRRRRRRKASGGSGIKGNDAARIAKSYHLILHFHQLPLTCSSAGCLSPSDLQSLGSLHLPLPPLPCPMPPPPSPPQQTKLSQASQSPSMTFCRQHAPSPSNISGE